ncbi:hypothetical protein KY290_007395 [Solanum tuberosum]|uniref:NB-ARC domain containing protein n=1 Tax=Solanum tuberosum TaxID=4113 RepID=A0ABQ7W5G7_SOLTU|nr:hypothetical protein KY290_007395 [Solanum tuberosum]
MVGRKANEQIVDNSTQLTNRFAALSNDPQASRLNNNENQEAKSQQEDTTDQQGKYVQTKEWVLHIFMRPELHTQRAGADPISEQVQTTLEKPLDTLQSSDATTSVEGVIDEVLGSVECQGDNAAVNFHSPVADIEVLEDNISGEIIAIPHQQVVLPLAMSSPAIQDNNQQSDNQVSMLTKKVQVGGGVDVTGEELLNTSLSQAIVKVPRMVQMDDSQLIQIESPNKVLHDIISHNIDVGSSGNNESYGTQIAKGLTEEDSIDELWDVQLEADLSPRLLKCARKGKKQGNGDKNAPIRVQPKRVKTTSNKQ